MFRRGDPERFGEWLANPPPELVRGKGNVWLANRCDQSFGYSCAGTVHRVFAAGRWWAGYGGSTWPTCNSERRRLLEHWHPRFGDRRQEIAFLGIDLDESAISAALDSCLLSEEEAFELVTPSAFGPATYVEASGGAGLH